MTPRPSHLLALLSLGALACGPRDEAGMATDTALPAASESPSARMTYVRVVHAIPGVNGIDLLADDRPEVSNVAFRSVSRYEQMPNEIQMFRVIRAGETGAADSVTLARSNELALTGQYHTLIVFGTPDDSRDRAMTRGSDTADPSDVRRTDTGATRATGGTGAAGVTAGGGDSDIQLAHVRDDEPLNDSTQARLRVVNAATNTEDLDVVISGREEPVFDNIGYGVQVHSVEVPAGSVTIQVRREGQTTPLTRVANVNLGAGTTTTLILTHPSPTSDRIEVIRLTDDRNTTAPAGGDTGRGTDTSTTGTRATRDTTR